MKRGERSWLRASQQDRAQNCRWKDLDEFYYFKLL